MPREADEADDSRIRVVIFRFLQSLRLFLQRSCAHLVSFVERDYLITLNMRSNRNFLTIVIDSMSQVVATAMIRIMTHDESLRETGELNKTRKRYLYKSEIQINNE